MGKKVKPAIILAVSVLFCLVFGMTAFAATRKKINKVSFTISGNINVGDKMGTENLDITNSAANYTYDYYEVQNLGFSWSPDDTPEIKVYLNAEAVIISTLSGQARSP